MKIIPFRIKPSIEEDNFAEIYEFLIKGSNKDAYIVEIYIDDANDLGVILTECTCPHHKYRAEECKHIKQALNILSEYGIINNRSDEIPEIETREIFKENPNMIEPVLSDSEGNYLPLNDCFNSSNINNANNRQDERANSKEIEVWTPESPRAINGDGNPADSSFVQIANNKGDLEE
jgi:hypothetical protein